MNLGLAQLALKTHVFSSCINSMLQLNFSCIEVLHCHEFQTIEIYLKNDFQVDILNWN